MPKACDKTYSIKLTGIQARTLLTNGQIDSIWDATSNDGSSKHYEAEDTQPSHCYQAPQGKLMMSARSTYILIRSTINSIFLAEDKHYQQAVPDQD